MHEAYERDAVVDRLDAQPVTSKHRGDADLLAVHADAAAGGNHDAADVEWVFWSGRSMQGREEGL
jgi:hypothetical protein